MSPSSTPGWREKWSTTRKMLVEASSSSREEREEFHFTCRLPT